MAREADSSRSDSEPPRAKVEPLWEVKHTVGEGPSIYRNHCNTCGAKLGVQHAAHCHLTGEVVAFSGVRR